MISCSVYADRGLTRLVGSTPNGVTTVTRTAEGVPDTVLRNGDGINVTSGGWVLEDSEGPVGVPLIYRTDIEVVDRVIQQNTVLTPNFMHGVQGWVAGSGRTLTTESDITANHPTIGHFGSNGGGYTLAAPPTLVGNVNSAPEVLGPYTLTPTTSGGSAIATGDWVYIVHQNESAYVVQPAMPAGFTQIGAWTGTGTKLAIWRRKRQAGDSGYTVNQASTATGLGTCFWVRGASDALPALSSLLQFTPGIGSAVILPGVTGVSPSLTMKIAAVQLTAAGSKIDSTQVIGWGGGTTPYVVGNDPNTRSLLVASERNLHSQDTETMTAVYPAPLADVLAIQMLFPNTTALTGRTVAKAKLAAMTNLVDSPYRITGRVRFTSVNVWTWDDVLANGTWDDLLADKATWADVLSTAVVTTGQIARLYAIVVNPTTGAYLTDPIQVLGIEDDRVNTWMDFVAYFTPTADIPSNAELWFVHGTYSRDYSMEWYLDSIGITSGQQLATRDALWYLDGDLPRPLNSVNAMDPDGNWTTPLDDSVVQWSGTPGNSVSVWLSPTKMRGTTSCQIDWPQTEVIPCEPMMISDPVSSALGMWVGLLGIDTLSHNARGSDVDVINRSDPVAISSTRSWERGRMRLLTTTIADRKRMLSIFKSGRVLLIRNPDPDYPENNWYLACGNVDESRLNPDHRDGIRAWDVPFTRVARPSGLIEASAETTWEDVAETWTWDELKAARATWLDVLTRSVSDA